MTLLLAMACTPGPLGRPGGSPSTSETAATASGATGHTAVDTGWALDPSCVDPVDLPVDIVGGRTHPADVGIEIEHGYELLGEVMSTEADLAARIDPFAGVDWTGGIDWETEHALMVVMRPCNQQPLFTFTRLRRCADGRVVIDASRDRLAGDMTSKTWWVFAVPPGTYSGSQSRITVCSSAECWEYLDGVLVP